MHELLRRQLKRVGLDPDTPSGDHEAWADLLKRVSRSYEESDRTTYRHQRALEVSSREMQQLYEELRRSSASDVGLERSRLRSIIDAMEVGIATLAQSGEVLLLNTAGAVLLGQPEASLIGQRILRRFDFAFFTPHGDRQNSAALFGRVAVGESITGVPGYLIHEQREDVPVTASMAPIRPHDPDTDIVLIFRDETNQLITQEALQRSEHHYGTLVRRAPIAIWEEDFSKVGTWLDERRHSGVSDIRAHLRAHPEDLKVAVGLVTVLEANLAAATLVGAESPNDLIGSITTDLTDPNEAISWIEQFTAIWEGRDWLELEYSGSRHDGSPFQGILRWTAPRTGERLDLSRVVVTIVDITAQKESERKMQELVRSKDEFLAAVSHELRTPLTAVHTSAGVLQDQWMDLGEEEHVELIGYIARESKDMANIVEDLLVGARADIGKLSVLIRPIDLRTECETVVRRLGTTHESAQDVDASQLAGTALADPLRFRQIVRNLLTNAFRYGGERIWFEQDHSNSDMVLRVCDDGPGIPDHEQDAIFEPYHRAQVTPGMPGSVGMGLSVSRTLAELMEGSLSYAANGHGSAFELKLPLASSAELGLDTGAAGA